MLGAWLVSLALIVHASAESYTLHHRFLPSGEFAPRGVVSLSDFGATFTAEPNARVLGEGEGEWYQVALEVGGDMITTSTRSCFVAEDALLTVHVAGNGRPTSIEFKPAVVPNDGACPSAGARSPKSGIKVAVETPQRVFSPRLGAPPEVDTSTGKVKEPEPEKTFLQKYGLMLAGAAFVLMLNAGGAAEPQRAEGGAAPAG